MAARLMAVRLMAGASGNGGAPAASRAVVEGEVRRALTAPHRNPRNSVLLLRAVPEWRDAARFSVDVGGTPVPVAVAACPTVLAVLDAISADRADGECLVVLTPLTERDVGDSVLARAIQPAIKPVNRWDLVEDAFGARRLDPALTRSVNAWIAEALLDAQPAGGWRRLAGTVLTRATALNRLAATRLGIEDADDSPADAAALLQWTTDAAAVASFLHLREKERAGLTGWLKETIGPVADVVFGMAEAGKIPDAVPFGLVVKALYDPEDDATPTARVRAEERYLAGSPPGSAALRAFGEAAESLVTRWADNGHAARAADLRQRAERIIAELSGGDDGSGRRLAGRSRVLEAGLDARLAALGEALSAGRLPAAEEALRLVRDHDRRRDRDAEIRAAEAAVRLARWLAVPEEPPAALAGAATRMLRSWGWADRALAAAGRAGTSHVPRLEDAYAALWRQARQRRAALDEAFARKLAAWTEAGSDTDLIGVENLAERIARPVAAKRLPVIVVLDGMSAAVGCELAEEITGRGGWLEAGRRADGREPALATVPSVTAISRTSLLTGTLQAGGQERERSGFAAFWGRQSSPGGTTPRTPRGLPDGKASVSGRHPSALFHKGDLAPEPGRPLADAVRDAIGDADTVVGVVLNTIDDTLDRGKHGPAHWGTEMVTYLDAVLDEARRAGRPVILTADHGHVLHREQDPGSGPGHLPPAVRAACARYRAGAPGPGEITVRGPRVLTADGKPGGEVVAAVDEAIHYTPRKAGYHGGASPAEVVVPVITLLPDESLLPDGWYLYDAVGHAPAWWNPPPGREPPAPAQAPRPAEARPAPARRKRQAAVPEDSAALFGAEEVIVPSAATMSLGAQVTASPRMAAQRQAVRRAPAQPGVAALIDALAAAGGRLTLAEAAEAAGEPPVRMSGYLAQVIRLLNVDGYAVLQAADGGRMVKLNEQLLRQQFLAA